MGNQNPDPSYHAVLIGIDAYPTRPLNSCVRDIEKIKDCLEINLSSVDIYALTASRSTSPGTTPIEKPKCWPTYNNVIELLASVTKRANPGDFVYIHYSGHGTRMEPIPEFDYSNQSTGDLALVLLVGHGSQEEYLRGPSLAGLLSLMIEKELIITLVLDCCFSASVYRNSGDDATVRYLSYEGLAYSSVPEDSRANMENSAANRTASMRDNWLLNPDRYTILAACGPHEIAKGGSETREKGARYGVLSYFLSNTLSDYGLGRRHKDIYRHLCARFWGLGAQQHPVLYGNGDQGFFGPVDPNYAMKAIRTVKSTNGFRLLAGEAHGFSKSDQFLMHPPELENELKSEGASIAKIIRAGPLTSDLELQTTNTLQREWIAEPRVCSFLTRFYVQLMTGLPDHDEWLIELEKQLLSTHNNADQVPTLKVMLDNDNYIILNQYGQKINLPEMPRGQTTISYICDILKHLAQFKMVKDLTNKSPADLFQRSFHVRITSDKEQFDPEEQIEVHHNTFVWLEIENIGHADLYAYVYELSSLWEIKMILSGTHQVVPAPKRPSRSELGLSGKFSIKIRMTIPPELYKEGLCEDIIKVFITSQPTLFDFLELPKLHELAKTNAGDRAGYSNNPVLEDWAAFNFPIRTILRNT